MEKLRRIIGTAPIESKMFGAFILSIAAMVAFRACQVLNMPKIQEDEIALSDRTSQKPRGIEKYIPPAELGRVVAEKFDPKVTKTIIYFADRHPMSTDDSVGMNVQSELYGMFEDIIERYGKLPMVIENWPDGIDYSTSPIEVVAGLFQDIGADGNFVATLMAEPDFAKRREMLRGVVGKDIVPAGMYAMLSRKELVPLGSINPYEAVEVNQGIREMSFVNTVISDPSAVVCENNLEMKFAEAQRKFLEGKRSKAIVDCYCGTRLRVRNILDKFVHDRTVLAPGRECEAAARYLIDGGDFVIIVAGTNHIPESLRFMERAGVNYTVIAPKGIAKNFPAALTQIVKPDVDFADDANGTCAKLEPAHRAKLEAEAEARMRKQIEALMEGFDTDD